MEHQRRLCETRAHVLPKSGTHRPWNVRHNYLLDAIDHRFDRIEESMVFGRVPTRPNQQTGAEVREDAAKTSISTA